MKRKKRNSEMSGKHIYALVASCLMAWGVMGMLNAYGVFFTPMGEALNATKGEVTLHYSLRTLTCGLASPLVAKLLEKKVNVRVMMLIGAAVFLAANILIAFSSSIIMVDILAVIAGLGLALISFMLITIFLGNWFRRNLATFTGIAVSFSGIGGAIMSPVVTKLLSAFEFRTVYIIYAILTVVMVLPLVFSPFYPEDAGLKAYGAGDNQNMANPLKRENYLNMPYKLFSPVMIIVLMMTLLIVGLTSLNSHLPSLAISNGFTADIGALLLSASMIGNLTSKFALGLLIDKLGVFKGFIVILCTCIAGFLIILFVKAGTAPLLAGGYLYGTIFSLGSLGLSMLARYVYGNAQYNTAYSKMTLVTSLGSAAFVSIIGFMYDSTGSYRSSVVMGIAMAAVILALTVYLMIRLKGQKNTVKA